MLLLRRIVTFPVRVLLRWLIVSPWDFLSLETRGNMLRPNYIRLGNPDRLLALMARILRPLLGRWMVTIAVTYFLLGLGLLVGHFDAWWGAVEFLWNPWGVVVIALAGIFAVHVPHQLAHGVVLVHHGAAHRAGASRSCSTSCPPLGGRERHAVADREEASNVGGCCGLLWRE